MKTFVRYFLIVVLSAALFELAAFFTVSALSKRPGYDHLARQIELPHPLFRKTGPGNPVPLSQRSDDSNFFEFDPRFAYRHKASTLLYQDPGGGRLMTGSERFICNEACEPLPRTKPPGEIRIFIFGGSSVAGGGPGHHGGTTISGRLERMIVEATLFPGRKVRVVNAGVGGWFSAQELSLFALDVVGYAPDMVIFFDGYNDRGQWFYDATYKPRLAEFRGLDYPNLHEYGYSLTGGVARVRTFSGALLHAANLAAEYAPLFHYSVVLARHVRRMAMGFEAGTKEAYATTTDSDRDAVLTRLLTSLSDRNINSPVNYVDNLRSAAGIARAHGFPALLVLQPATAHGAKNVRSPLEQEWLAKAKTDLEARATVEYFNRAQVAFAREAQSNDRFVRFVDMTGIFKDEKEPMWFDPIHYTVAGNEAIARHLLAHAREMLAGRQ